VEARLVRLVVVVVTCVWAVSFIADIVLDAYEPSPFIHGAMMLIVGGATGRYIVLRNGSRDGR
jgi:hypothetical protein